MSSIMKKYNLFYLTFILYISLYASVICGVAIASEKTKSFLNIESILEGWESNYLWIKTMQVSYTERVLDANPPTTNPNLYNNLLKHEHVERIEEGKHYHIRYSGAENGFTEPENIMEHAFDGKVTTEYWAKKNVGTIDLGLTGRNVETKNILPTYMHLDTVRSLRFSEEFPQGMPRLSCVLKTAISKSTSIISPNLELISGQTCHLLVIEDKIEEDVFKYEIWFAHEKGLLPMKYKSYKNNILSREIEVEEIGSTETETGYSWYPKKAYRSLYGKNGQEIRYGITTHTFVPNVKTDKNTFRIDFPDGTEVVDNILGIYYIKGVGDIDGAQIVRELNPSKTDPAVKGSIQTTPDLNEISTEEKVPPSTFVTDEDKDEEEGGNNIKLVTTKDKDKILGLKSLSLLGVIIVAVFSLLFWYRQHTTT